MSGFFGILRSDGREVDPDLLQRVAGALRFRGPDGENTWHQQGSGACFSYLATGPARQATQQPVSRGADWLIGDLRLDAKKQLIDQIHASGNTLIPDSTDEELLLLAWKIWGESCLQQILGDFSFALWDHNRSSLWCTRDFAGPRPFYYVHTPGFFCFSNTLTALQTVPGVSSELDEIFIGEFLLRGYCSDLSRTAYADIRRLPAGHLLQYHQHTVSIRRFLTLPIEDPFRFSRPDEYLEAYRHVLREAVQDRLPGGPTALYLSGGLDSSSVCAMAAELTESRNQRDKLKTFTVSWRALFEDQEPHFATLSATHLGLSHQILEDRNFEPFTLPRELMDHTPELTCDATFALAQEYYREIATHSRVILSGDGGDDVLMGQSWPYFVHLWTTGQRLEIARTLSEFVWTHGTLPPLRAGVRGKLRQLMGQSKEWKGYPEWLNPEFEERLELRDRWMHKQAKLENQHPMHPNAYAAIHSGYWSTILESEDAGNTRVPLEPRAPLLDLRVLRFLLRVPPVPWCVNKELVRRSLRNYLPEAVLNRPKTPLVEDPLVSSIATGKWTPKIPDRPFAGAERFIDWSKWKAVLKYSKDCTSPEALLPFALVMWLKDIENADRIQ